MLKRMLRRSKGDYTPIELYILGEKTFFNREIKKRKIQRVEELEIEMKFLKRENRMLYTRSILVH